MRLLTLIVVLALAASAQKKPEPAPAEDDFQRMLDLSHPGPNHKLLAALVGRWDFVGKQAVNSPEPFTIRGSIERKAVYDGRFYIAETSSAEDIPLPMADGSMKPGKYHDMEVEGYDNAKKKFVASTFGNHVGSGITNYEGTYDPATKTITLTAEEELLPGQKNRRIERIKFVDADHYQVAWYIVDGGKEQKVTEVDCTRKKP